VRTPKKKKETKQESSGKTNKRQQDLKHPTREKKQAIRRVHREEK
jgi:hypothetical protein